MTRGLITLAVALALLAPQAWAQTKLPVGDEPVPATFKIVAVANRPEAGPGTRTFRATYGAGETQVAFLIEFEGSGGVKGVGADAPVDITFFRGRFRHVAGGKPDTFMTKLAIALEAKAPKRSQAKAETVPFEIAVFGRHDSRLKGGGFTDKPPGDWVTSKLFMGAGDAEVFFNFNPVSGDAEFAIKDEDYGATIVEELSKVLW